jgi:hypothetical protein
VRWRGPQRWHSAVARRILIAVDVVDNRRVWYG